MKTTIDKAGRIVVPKRIREAAKLEAGSELEIQIEDGLIVIEPVPAAVELVKEGRLTVARTKSKTEPLTQMQVNAALEKVRGERAMPAARKRRKP